jgi:hypothetical protein
MFIANVQPGDFAVKKQLSTIAAAAAFLATTIIGAQALPPPHVVTPADTIHPDIHHNVGNGGANPATGNLHGIDNVPGQNGAHPSTGDNGFADQLNTVHGGIGAYNPNTPPPE